MKEEHKCIECGKMYIPWRKTSTVCSKTCAARMGGRARKIRSSHKGENNPNWKGGISKDNYRYKLIQKERYPEKIKARGALYHAVRRGKIKKEPCCECGDEDSHAHHEDYAKPLEIVWLCRKHHRERHGNLH